MSIPRQRLPPSAKVRRAAQNAIANDTTGTKGTHVVNRASIAAYRLSTLHLYAAVDAQTTRDEEVERQGETWTRSKNRKTRLTPTTTETCPLKPPPPQSSTSPSHPPHRRPTTIPSLPRPTVHSPSSRSLTTGYSLAMMLKFWFVRHMRFLLGLEASRLIIATVDRRRAEDLRRV